MLTQRCTLAGSQWAQCPLFEKPAHKEEGNEKKKSHVRPPDTHKRQHSLEAFGKKCYNCFEVRSGFSYGFDSGFRVWGPPGMSH
jgi:hypothetical protein